MKFSWMLPLGCAALLGATVTENAIAQEPHADVIRLDPTLDQIVSPNARLEMLKEGIFGINEGPLWMPEGYLLFSDIAANVIYKWTPDNQLSVFLKNSGFTGDLSKVWMGDYIDGGGPMYIYNFGSNGITLDSQNRIVYVSQGDRALVRLEHDGSRTVLADHYQGKRLNRPNDVVVKSDGTIYFTDPLANKNPTMELSHSEVWMYKDGKLSEAIGDFKLPNGLAFSPDEKYLYVNDTMRMTIVRYDVNADDTLSNGKLLIDMSPEKATLGHPDGMKVDRAGNIYCTGPGGVWIITADGKHIGTILTPIQTATNLAFGDPDYKTLYITDRRSLVRIRLNTPGIAPGAPRS